MRWYSEEACSSSFFLIRVVLWGGPKVTLEVQSLCLWGHRCVWEGWWINPALEVFAVLEENINSLVFTHTSGVCVFPAHSAFTPGWVYVHVGGGTCLSFPILGTCIVGVCCVLHRTCRPHSQNTMSLCWECNLLLYVKVKWSCYRPGVAQRVGRGIALLFHNCGTRRGWVVSSTPQPHFTPGKDLVPILQEAGWAPGPVWTGAKSCPHWDSIPDRPARSQSLYQLSYPAHLLLYVPLFIHWRN